MGGTKSAIQLFHRETVEKKYAKITNDWKLFLHYQCNKCNFLNRSRIKGDKIWKHYSNWMKFRIQVFYKRLITISKLKLSKTNGWIKKKVLKVTLKDEKHFWLLYFETNPDSVRQKGETSGMLDGQVWNLSYSGLQK